MTLRTYLKQQGIRPYSAHDMASLLGVQTVHLGHVAVGKKRPSLELAVKIEEITKGEVTPKELLKVWQERSRI